MSHEGGVWIQVARNRNQLHTPANKNNVYIRKR
jgi:hypothetical protein